MPLQFGPSNLGSFREIHLNHVIDRSLKNFRLHAVCLLSFTKRAGDYRGTKRMPKRINCGGKGHDFIGLLLFQIQINKYASNLAYSDGKGHREVHN